MNYAMPGSKQYIAAISGGRLPVVANGEIAHSLELRDGRSVRIIGDHLDGDDLRAPYIERINGMLGLTQMRL